MKINNLFVLIIILLFPALIVAAPDSHRYSKKYMVSSGTGFFVNSNGYIITNQHVVNNCKDIYVRGSVPRTPATLVDIDKKLDLALLKTTITPRGYAKLRLAQSVESGERVMLVGYPMKGGLTGRHSVTTAKVIDTKGPAGEEEWIQFTDSAQKGNSGGPLIDKYGNVIGVIRAKMKFYQLNNVTGIDPKILTQQDIIRMGSEVKSSDIAITANMLQRFLNKNIIPYQTIFNIFRQSDELLENKTRKYIVNVHCVLGAVS